MTLVQADEQTDAELVRQAIKDRAAFASLYHRHLMPVYRYFYARTGNVQQAEDLTAQTFIAVLKGLPHYRERGTFAGWLFTIAARRLADHFNCHQTTVVLDDVVDLPDPDLSPEALAERADQTACMAQALRTLSPDRAQAVTLHFFGELTISETGRVMKRSKVAVKSLVHRALRDLRERLDNERE